MKINIHHKGKNYQADLSEPIDISIAYWPDGVRAFHADKVVMKPFEMDGFVGSMDAGSPVNYYVVEMNPHGNGTHTECLGHIQKEHQSVNQLLKHFHFMAELISIEPKKNEERESFIDINLIQKSFKNTEEVNALIIRTLPNSDEKLHQNYTSTHPTYLTSEAMDYIVNQGIKHLLIDLPSVDPEEDEGKVSAHKLFWQVAQEEKRNDATITELIYVRDEIEDGLYFLNLQIAPLELDASPSKPILYKVKRDE